MWRKKYTFALVAAAIPFMVVPTILAANTVIQANLCDPFIGPTITTPSSVNSTDDASARIDGTGQAGLTVTLIDNGANVGAATIAGDSTFSVTIPLVEGENHVKARITDACEYKDSNSIVLLRNITVTPGGGSTGGGSSGGGVGGVGGGAVGNARGSNDSTGIGGSSGATDDEGSSIENPPEVSSLPEEEPSKSNPTSGIDENGDITGTVKDTDSDLFRITFPPDGAIIQYTKVLVKGVAPPSSKISLYVNGEGIAQVIADSDGNFGIMVPLQLGANSIRAYATTPDDTIYRRTVTVQSVAPPDTVDQDKKIGGLTVARAIVLAAAAVTVTGVGVGATVLHAAHAGGIHFLRKRP